MKEQTIGVEIEMTGITRGAAAAAVAKYFGTAANYAGGTYNAYEVSDNSGRIWKLVRDGSIRAQRKVSGITEGTNCDYQVELVTPILKYGDIEILQEIVRVLRKAGGFVNESCGMHVHIGAGGFTPDKIRNLVNAVASKEDLLYKALEVHENRRRYCAPTSQRFLKELNEKKPATTEQLAEIWYDSVGGVLDARRRYRYDETRYTVCNLHSFFNKNTVEFRIFNATLHAGEVKSAMQFCLALTAQAKTTCKAIYRKTETGNPKYTMRCWMLRLGLIGDEFKTCRFHFLKNLEGNAAWRNATTA